MNQTGAEKILAIEISVPILNAASSGRSLIGVLEVSK